MGGDPVQMGVGAAKDHCLVGPGEHGRGQGSKGQCGGAGDAPGAGEEATGAPKDQTMAVGGAAAEIGTTVEMEGIPCPKTWGIKRIDALGDADAAEDCGRLGAGGTAAGELKAKTLTWLMPSPPLLRRLVSLVIRHNLSNI